jgi:hypothetical protein
VFWGAATTVSGMPESHASTVAGLIPAAVRIDLPATQVPLLVQELSLSLESIAIALRSHAECPPSTPKQALADHAADLSDQLALLQALSDHHGEPATVTVTLPTPTADTLIRNCTRRALDTLAREVTARSGQIAPLAAAADSVSAWTSVLADLRELDETGPDSIR